MPANNSISTDPVTMLKLGETATLDDKKISHCLGQWKADSNVRVGAVVALKAGSDYLVEMPTSTAAKVMGIAVFDRYHNYEIVNGAINYKVGGDVSILTKGCIVMRSEVAVKPYDPVYFRHTIDGALNVIGYVSNVAGTGLDLLKGAYFAETSTTGLVRVEYDFTP